MNHEQMFTLLDKVRHILDSPQDVDIVFQFRAAVTGSITPRFCHPFPIVKDQQDLDSLDVLTDCALTHNGVIFEYATQSWASKGKLTRDINDAQEFIKDYLVNMGDSLWNLAVQKMIEDYTMSKFALLSAKGITYIGDFIEDNGYRYSNEGYKGDSFRKKYIQRSYGFEEESWREETYFRGAQRPLIHKGEGGCRCDFCQDYHPVVYHLNPDRASKDYESIVCHACFLYLEGMPPTRADVAY